MDKLPGYEQISDTLLESRVFLEAAEAHGLLTGLLVCNPETSAEIWMIKATQNPDAWSTLTHELQTTLEQLLHITLAELHNADLRLELLLPDEQEVLAERAHALGLWCKGFVNGVESHGNYLGELMGRAQEEVDEALSDLNSIAEVDYQIKEHAEYKKALSAVIEYVRIAVLLVQRELSSSFNTSKTHDSSLH